MPSSVPTELKKDNGNISRMWLSGRFIKNLLFLHLPGAFGIQTAAGNVGILYIRIK